MDAFRVVGVFFLCCIPLLLLFKRRKGPAAAPVLTTVEGVFRDGRIKP